MASTPDTATQLRSALASRGIDPFTHTQRARQLAEETVTQMLGPLTPTKSTSTQKTCWPRLSALAPSSGIWTIQRLKKCGSTTPRASSSRETANPS